MKQTATGCSLVANYLESSLDWLNVGFGMAERHEEEVDGKRIVFPSIPKGVDQTEYHNLFPTDEFESFVWCDVIDPIRVDQDTRKQVSSVGFVFWSKLPEGKTLVDLVDEAVTALTRISVYGVTIVSKRIYLDEQGVYPAYTRTAINSQFRMRPYVSFRISCEMTVWDYIC